MDRSVRVRRAPGLVGLVGLALLAACTDGGGAGGSESEPSPAPEASRSVDASATAPATPPPSAGPVTVTVVGDIMLGRGVAARNADPTATLQPLRALLRRADITVGNLENTLSTAGPPTQGDDSFSAPPAVLDGLADAGFDALSLANNHAGDHGPAALVETVDAFAGTPVRQFGAGRNLRESLRPVVVRRHGVRVGFLGFNAIGESPMAGPDSPGVLSVRMPPRTGPLQQADLARVVRAVRRLDRRVDAVVVLPHWGTQYTHVPEPVQSLVGRRLVDAGADLVVGGHPHWVQGVERHRGVRIFHSLGNFVFDMDFMEQTLEGVVLTATIDGGRVTDVELTPYRMDDRFAPRPLRGADGRAVLADMGSAR